MRFVAMFISYLLHPVLIPSYGIFLLIWCNPYLFGNWPSYDSVMLMQSVILNSAFFPMFTVFLMVRLGFVESMEVTDRRERVLVFMAISFFFLWTYFVLQKNQPEFVSDVMLGVCIALFASFIITMLVDKISIHAMGMGGLFAIALFATNIAIFDLTPIILLTILAAGLVGTARLLLNAHTPSQIYSGYMVGFLCQAIAIII